VTDSTARFGLDPRFNDEIKGLHTKIDEIMGHIDRVKEEAKTFYDKYTKDLDNKALFHAELDKTKAPRKEPTISIT
jgi:truncated hemoglobin YjbI